MTPRLQPLTRAKVGALGEAGRAWQESLPEVLAELAERWDLELGRGLPGGSASYVCAARTATGGERVLKVVVPDPLLADEAPVLRAAGGHGYALLHAAAPEHRALLLERLGPSLESLRPPVEAALDTLAATLVEAWRVPVDTIAPGLDRAADLWAMVERWDLATGEVCDRAALRAAGAAAVRLSAGDDPAAHVVAHGDPHPPNLLQVLGERAGAPAGFAFVDPDGVRCDPAYDVGVALRDWTGSLEGTDTRTTLRGWTRRMADRVGVDPGRAWDWAYLERVSTGLYLLSLGADRLARRFLDSAAALL